MLQRCLRYQMSARVDLRNADRGGFSTSFHRPLPPVLGSRASFSSRGFVDWSSVKAKNYAPASRTLGAIALAGLGVTYGSYTAMPLVLEESEDLVEQPLRERFGSRYLPRIPAGMDQVNAFLRWDERSSTGASSILRIDQSEFPSNLPAEDYLLCARNTRGDGELIWLVTAVFDGHAGRGTSETLFEYLFDYLMQELYQETEDLSTLRNPDEKIKKAFLNLDYDIMTRAVRAIEGPSFLSDAIAETAPAYSGSCALVSFYDEKTRELKVANTGDSRAVLGRRNDQGKWEATALSDDQTGANEDEIARLNAEHPNEPEMIQGGRLLGLAVTRAFGDGRWKWPRELQEKARDRFFGPELREPLLTPPYLTAEPVITTTKIHPERGDFLIMASDGLWDRVTSQQAVDLVSRWMASHDVTQSAPVLDERAEIPHADPEYRKGNNPNPTRRYTSAATQISEKNFTFIDDNAATHLIRNALGGADEDMLRGMITAASLWSREMRDDISIQVIFFGEESNVIRN